MEYRHSLWKPAEEETPGVQPHCWPAFRPLPQQSRASRELHCSSSRRGAQTNVE